MPFYALVLVVQALWQLACSLQCRTCCCFQQTVTAALTGMVGCWGLLQRFVRHCGLGSWFFWRCCVILQWLHVASAQSARNFGHPAPHVCGLCCHSAGPSCVNCCQLGATNSSVTVAAGSGKGVCHCVSRICACLLMFLTNHCIVGHFALLTLPFRVSWPVSRQPASVLTQCSLCRGPAIHPCIAPRGFLSRGWGLARLLNSQLLLPLLCLMHTRHARVLSKGLCVVCLLCPCMTRSHAASTRRACHIE